MHEGKIYFCSVGLVERQIGVLDTEGNTLSFIPLSKGGPSSVAIADGKTSLGAKQILVQPDQPTTAPVGSLWGRTEKLHKGLRYYTGSVGDDANVMCFLLDRIREVWRKEWSGWTLLTGKEL